MLIAYLYCSNNNLKFYFLYQKGVGFHVKVVFLGSTWKNMFKSASNQYKDEVALEE